MSSQMRSNRGHLRSFKAIKGHDGHLRSFEAIWCHSGHFRPFEVIWGRGVICKGSFEVKPVKNQSSIFPFVFIWARTIFIPHSIRNKFQFFINMSKLRIWSESCFLIQDLMRWPHWPKVNIGYVRSNGVKSQIRSSSLSKLSLSSDGGSGGGCRNRTIGNKSSRTYRTNDGIAWASLPTVWWSFKQ